ncbi:MAG: hypothetical protein HBSAPP02_03250 [Phycisphaerae bacterium]|nr:MAG: LUD domain-containing protein [Planctomycetia bacterium]RIK69849.1 MAG: hypothetical protein DCC66_07290 [Planctomycetota bacterium]GJQ25293.1 MAG: hypothetical protein HBSAPP02_03250 [Phycisphaerae bacterium]
MKPDGGLRTAVNQIARITARMARVPHPGDGPHRDVASAPAELAARFAERLDFLRAPGDDEPSVIRVATTQDAIASLARLCEPLPRQEIRLPEDADASPRDWKLGITPAWALVADTGSVVVEIPNAAAAFASLLVEQHCVVAGVDQLVPDLAELYRRLDPTTTDVPARNLVCITGCSRTADIEKLLVVPAHGPRQVRVVLCDEPVNWPILRNAIAP